MQTGHKVERECQVGQRRGLLCEGLGLLEPRQRLLGIAKQPQALGEKDPSEYPTVQALPLRRVW
jgi:hypothetical protein